MDTPEERPRLKPETPANRPILAPDPTPSTEPAEPTEPETPVTPETTPTVPTTDDPATTPATPEPETAPATEPTPDETENTPAKPEAINESLTPQERESLQQQVKQYRQAMEEEFAEEHSDHDHIVDSTLKYFEGNTDQACMQIVWLMNNSTSDSTRLSASKYVIDRVFKGAVDSPTDPVADIMSKLMATNASTAPPPENPNE